jgi:hypothetical protein
MAYNSSFARPALADAPLVLVSQYFGSTVFLRERSRYLPFDQETTQLLIRSKDQPFSQIIEQQPKDEDREALFAFFEHFYNMGFFTLDHRFAGEIVDIRPPVDHLAGPLAVHLEVIATCNLTCKHCFAGDLPRQENPLSLEELDELFASLSRMGSYRLGLTGGGAAGSKRYL